MILTPFLSLISASFAPFKMISLCTCFVSIYTNRPHRNSIAAISFSSFFSELGAEVSTVSAHKKQTKKKNTKTVSPPRPSLLLLSDGIVAQSFTPSNLVQLSLVSPVLFLLLVYSQLLNQAFFFLVQMSAVIKEKKKKVPTVTFYKREKNACWLPLCMTSWPRKTILLCQMLLNVIYVLIK